MQFQIPQFIEVEDKIFGPLTFRQFIYVVGALGAAYLLYRILPIYISLIFIVPIIALGAGLAFFQYNGRPFILALESGFSYFFHPKLYLWNNERKRQTVTAKRAAASEQGGDVYIPKLSDSKLHELAWSLDIKERLASGIGDEQDKQYAGGVVAPVMTMRDAMR